LPQERLETFEHKVDGGIEQRMAGCQQLSLGLAGNQRLLEVDACIAVKHRIATTNQPVALLEGAGHAGNFEAPALPLDDPAAEPCEGFPEEGTDEVRLEASGLRPLHFLADGRDDLGVEAFRGELALRHQGFDRANVNRAIDFSEQFSFLLGPVAIADRVDQEGAKGLALEQLAKHVVDLAAKRRACLLQLV
jgi:hypothetical protein